jgi:antitoxin (DNA-binding transcriptional repressor) of toxin-antitoxin stability system
MRIENIRKVKTRFSRYVKEMSKSGSVLITKNGRPCAASASLRHGRAKRVRLVASEQVVDASASRSHDGTRLKKLGG